MKMPLTTKNLVGMTSTSMPCAKMAIYIVDIYQLQEIVVTKAMKGFQVIKVSELLLQTLHYRQRKVEQLQPHAVYLQMTAHAKMLVVVRLTGFCVSK